MFLFWSALFAPGFYTKKANTGVNFMETFLDKICAFLLLGVFVLALLGAIDYFIESMVIFKRALKKYKDRNRH
jgi:membrane-bound acyltransferase YfiQ involved in biofilm formation